jgi:hypothetical protein
MEWEVWLEKTSRAIAGGNMNSGTGLRPSDIRELQDLESQDKTQAVATSDTKYRSSKTGKVIPKEQYDIENKSKTVKDIKKKPTMFPRIRREFEDDDEDPMVYNDNKKSWESWLDKNNATETSHKDGEKKIEWDGKFSSSTIEDEVKNEDEKSESE